MSDLAASQATPEPRADRRGRVLLSVVFSFRNEAEILPELLQRMEAVLGREDVQYELIFVNDASTDASLDILLRARDTNTRIKIVNMARRFGVAECLLAGLAAASGDAVVYLDTDLQDPPEVIPELIARWRAGADVVHTVRSRRKGEKLLKIWATGLAYRVIQFGSSLALPVEAGDFKLLSRAVVQHLLRFRESDPYLRGLVVWVGFTQAFVPYERTARHAGQTHFPFFSKGPWKTFVVGLTSFSFLPLYVCAALAALGLTASFVLAGLSFLTWMRGGAAGSMALAGLVAFMWATTVGAVGTVGLYVLRIYKDVRGRPPYIVRSTVGIVPSRMTDDAPVSVRAEPTE